MKVKSDIENKLNHDAVDQFEVFNDLCGDNDQPNQSHTLRFRDRSISSDEMAERQNKKGSTTKYKPKQKRPRQTQQDKTSTNTSRSSNRDEVESIDSSDVYEVTDESEDKEDTDEDVNCGEVKAISDDDQIKSQKRKRLKITGSLIKAQHRAFVTSKRNPTLSGEFQ